jgi:hypothetical protein
MHLPSFFSWLCSLFCFHLTGKHLDLRDSHIDSFLEVFNLICKLGNIWTLPSNAANGVTAASSFFLVAYIGALDNQNKMIRINHKHLL